ncbi:unnamed protein product [Fraxinus pennsylvanica]|uniref:Gnk2-homologous domain-containing protein n=1 Tax=Fraxinus pennsylvanica TaxID=56036 RepID=A0AAD2EC95_9LAMI|nr:unnamed protein product [Fraxinus pennsylvanica]
MVKSQDHWCLNNGNYTSNSTYKANLDTLLYSITSLIDGNGFYNASYGENSDRLNAMALCRGDFQLDKCRSCITNATDALLQLCPYQKQAIYWAAVGNCMVRYSNESIFGKLATDPRKAWLVTSDAPSRQEFNRDLRTLLDNLRSQAAYGGAGKKFAAANTTAPDLLTLYGLVQCTPDLSSDDCSDCLIQVAEIIPQCCNGKLGFGVYCPSCLLRYETYLFYNDTSLPAPPPPPMSLPTPPLPAPPGKDKNTTQTIINVIVPIIVGLIVALCIGFFLRFRQNHKPRAKLETRDEISSVESVYYEFGIIRAATDNFSNANVLGQGGFGIVYKAWKNWHEGMITNVIDPALRTSSRSFHDIMRCIHIGLLCVQEDAADRPTMASIVLMLTSFSITLPIPSQPAFFVSSCFDPKISLLRDLKSIPSETKESSYRRSSNSACLSINDATMSELYPR